MYQVSLGMITKGVLFHQNNAPAHSSVVVMATIPDCGFQLVSHPPCSPELTPLDFQEPLEPLQPLMNALEHCSGETRHLLWSFLVSPDTEVQNPVKSWYDQKILLVGSRYMKNFIDQIWPSYLHPFYVRLKTFHSPLVHWCNRWEEDINFTFIWSTYILTLYENLFLS